MIRAGAIAISLFIVSLACAITLCAQPPSASPAEQYRALLKQYQDASGGGAPSDEARMQLVGRVYRLRDELADRFVALAEKHPNDPVAEDALIQAIWQVNNTPWPVALVGKDERWLRAFPLLERDHIASKKLGEACERLSWGFRQEYEPFLRAVLERSPRRDVQAQACLALAHYLNTRIQRLDLLAEQPAVAEEFAELFGKQYLEALRKQDPRATSREAEALCERALHQYADVKLAADETVGERAAAELFELRHLVVGKPAPEIVGVDQDGRERKLSDYRGKVVLLDFWSEY